MYRLLIVDDEEQIVDWLYELFKAETGMDLDVYKAYSGSEALEWLNRTAIDIVLADINMPGMNGIELMKRIKETWPSCRVIFLTGYDEFDYVYTAQKYDGVAYLLKSESDNEIVRTVEKAVNEIEAGFRNSEMIINAKEQIKKTIPFMQKDFMTDLVEGMLPSSGDIQENLDALDIPLTAVHPVLMLTGRIDPAVVKMSSYEHRDMLCTVNMVIEKYMRADMSYVYVIHERSYMVWFIQPSASLKKHARADVPRTIWNVALNCIKDAVRCVQMSCREAMGITVSFALENEPCEWDSIADRYTALRRQMNSRIGTGNEMILIDDYLPGTDDRCIQYKNTEVEKACSRLKMASSLSTLLESGQRREFFEIMHQVSETLRGVGSLNYGPAIEIYYTISLQFLSYVNRYGLEEKIAFKLGLYKLSRHDEHMTWNDAVNYFFRLAEIIFEIQKDEQKSRSDYIVAQVKQHIGRNIQKELSVYSLGEFVHLNPIYLSRLFKQSTGMNLSEYIINERIKEAKRLLENKEMKIHEIAQAVGCTSSNYFSRLFKKVTGITPQEYRSRMISD